MLLQIYVFGFGNSEMFTEDLQFLGSNKDISESCVFDWPDRPEESLPPNYPPGDPPFGYPYLPEEDWPFIPPNERPNPGSNPDPDPTYPYTYPTPRPPVGLPCAFNAWAWDAMAREIVQLDVATGSETFNFVELILPTVIGLAVDNTSIYVSGGVFGVLRYNLQGILLGYYTGVIPPPIARLCPGQTAPSGAPPRILTFMTYSIF